MYLYKVGTWSSVPINQGILISEVSFKKGSTVCCLLYLYSSYFGRALSAQEACLKARDLVSPCL